MDKAFSKLFNECFSGQEIDWDSFHSAAIAFFDRYPQPLGGEHDAYFTNFTPIWNRLTYEKRLSDAQKLWREALAPARKWEAVQPGRRVHKGTPFYFWGGACLAAGDIDKGYALVHAAFAEDSKTPGRDPSVLPAGLLARLDADGVNQAFRPYVRDQERWLYKQIQSYSIAHGRAFSLADFKTKFLKSPPDNDTLFLFAYTVARLRKIEAIRGFDLDSEFLAQLEINALCDLLLVVDAIAKSKSGLAGSMFKPIAEEILRAANVHVDLGLISNRVGKGDVDNVVQDLLEGNFPGPNGVNLQLLQRDVGLALAVRNHGSHNTKGSASVRARYDEVKSALLNTLFAAVDHF